MVRKRFWLDTPVKRSDLVFANGVGSVVRLTSGTTAVVAGLPEWEKTIPIPPQPTEFLANAKRDEYLASYVIRDPRMESACEVSRFIQPPRAVEDDNSDFEWKVPVVRFPMTEMCGSPLCGKVFFSKGAAGAEYCPRCSPESQKGKKNRQRSRQLAVFYVCPAGHIDDIDWQSGIQHAADCHQADIRGSVGESIRSLRLRCDSCSQRAVVEHAVPCTGRRPWLPSKGTEACGERMVLTERTSVRTYYPQTRVSLHVPTSPDLEDDVLDWLRSQDRATGNSQSDDFVGLWKKRLESLGELLSLEETRAHLRFLEEEQAQSGVRASGSWDELAIRSRELDVFLGLEPAKPSKKLEFCEVGLDVSPRADLLGANGLFSRIVAIARLSDTRVLSGFTRVRPGMVDSRRGHELLWGFNPNVQSWLPAYRGYGEGILFVLNPFVLKEKRAPIPDVLVTVQQVTSNHGLVAHALAHALMLQLANVCGYQLPSLRDRIYDLPDGRVAFLVYVTESDVLGTLGGLVYQSRVDLLAGTIENALLAMRWCSQDPVCLPRVTDREWHRAGVCHQCLLLPETSCEIGNNMIDRGSVVGCAERGLTGVV